MKILFISGYYPPVTRGGGELSTHYLAQGLIAAGHDVQVLAEGKTSDGTVESVPVYRRPIHLTSKPLLERRAARKQAKIIHEFIKQNGPFDIIHAHDFRSALALSELNLPNAIATARDYAQICGSPNNLLADGTTCPGCTSLKNVLRNRAVSEAPWPRKPFRVWQYRYNIKYRLAAFRKFKHQIFISQAQLKEIDRVQDLSHTQTHVIYNPIPPDFLERPAPYPKSATILFVGTVESYKGVGILLEAFSRLAADNADVHLRIIGTGAQLNRYRNLVERRGLTYRVKFEGRLPSHQMRRAYDNASVLVAPHLWVEPFGRTTVEAMARCRPVVVSDLGGPNEIVSQAQAGFIFKHGDSEDLARKLKEALEIKILDRNELTRRAQSWVANNLSADRVSSLYGAVYKELTVSV